MEVTKSSHIPNQFVCLVACFKCIVFIIVTQNVNLDQELNLVETILTKLGQIALDGNQLSRLVCDLHLFIN